MNYELWKIIQPSILSKKMVGGGEILVQPARWSKIANFQVSTEIRS